MLLLVRYALLNPFSNKSGIKQRVNVLTLTTVNENKTLMTETLNNARKEKSDISALLASLLDVDLSFFLQLYWVIV